MIKLVEWLNQSTLDLHYSLEESGIEGVTVLLNDEGYLPEGFTSPYRFFCQVSDSDASPLYFNQLPIPEYWQITGTSTQAEIWNRSAKRGTIVYHEPTYLRLIKRVDWLDPFGKLYLSEHYNQYGWCFARTTYTNEGQATTKRYFNEKGQEVISENLVTGSVLLDWQGKVYHFTKKLDFYLFYLRESGLPLDAIGYNSLGLPFLLAYYLGGKGNDILFWQETINDDIPGNMRVLLSGNTSRQTRVVVEDKASFEKLLELSDGPSREKISYLSLLYPSLRENQGRKEILILTNSDQIEGLESLVSGLQDYRFHIAALTSMSPKLIDFDEYQHVHLYPNIAPKQLADLLEQCDIYMDINHGSEVESIVRRAFEQSMLILAFDNTVHNRQFIVDQAIFNHDDPMVMVRWCQEHKDYQAIVSSWRKHLSNSTVADYRRLLNDFSSEGED